MDRLEELMAVAASAAPQVREMPDLVPGLVLHVDGDMICYSCAGNDECAPGKARQNAIDKIESLRLHSGAEKVVVHMTTPGCHKGERYLIATVKPYQGQRTSGRRPKNHGYLQDWLLGYTGEHFRVKSWATREADDGIGVCSHHAAGQPGCGYIAIATKDKDMRMLPGLHVDWDTYELVRVMPGDFEVWNQPEDGFKLKLFGTKWFWMQMLHGDTVDNIPGLPGYVTQNAKGETVVKPMGEKTAEKFLENKKTNEAAFAEVYGLYCEYYEHMGFTFEEADDRFCEQAALLWMRTDQHAAIDNFAKHRGHGRIDVAFPDELRVAAGRMVLRVEKLRAENTALAD